MDMKTCRCVSVADNLQHGRGTGHSSLTELGHKAGYCTRPVQPACDVLSVQKACQGGWANVNVTL